MMIGVPVNPIRAQLGSAFSRFACSALPCDRCASSTSTTTSSDVSSTPSDFSSSSAFLRDSGLRYFWIIAKTSALPGVDSSSLTFAPGRRQHRFPGQLGCPDS